MSFWIPNDFEKLSISVTKGYQANILFQDICAFPGYSIWLYQHNFHFHMQQVKRESFSLFALSFLSHCFGADLISSVIRSDLKSSSVRATCSDTCFIITPFAVK